MNKRTVVFVCLILIASMVVPSVSVMAKKPDKPPGGGGDPTVTGTIYYHIHDGTDPWLYTMDADGSDKTQVMKVTNGISVLSHQKHGSHYWFIGLGAVDDVTYPDGEPGREIIAVRDDGLKTVDLTIDDSLALSQYCWKPRWGWGDTFISFAAKKWVQTDGVWAIEEAGIYKQTISFDANGDVTGLSGSASLVYDPGLLYIEDMDFYMIDSDSHNWAPDNTMIVNSEQGADLNVVDLDAQGGPTETYLTKGWSPHWSPDGNLIAFVYAYDLRIIEPDGTDETVLAKNKEKGNTEIISAPAWSPDSKYVSHLKYTRNMSTWSVKSNIYFIGIDGNDNTCITKDLSISMWKYNWDWR